MTERGCFESVRGLAAATALAAALAAGAGAQDDPQTYLYDTVTAPAARLGPAALTNRPGWARIPEDKLDHAFGGAAVMANNRLAVALRRGAAGAEVYSLTPRGPVFRASLGPGGPAGAGLASWKIAENTPAGVRADATFAGAEGERVLVFRLVPGEPMAEVTSGGRGQQARADAAARCVVVPNYFGDDMVFGPGSFASDAVDLPIEQMFLSLLGQGDCILMGVCETGSQGARATAAGTGAERGLTGVEALALPDRKLWFAFIEDAGVWAFFGPGRPAGQDAWKPPFQARWREDTLGDDGMAVSRPWGGGAPQAEQAGADRVVYPLERDRATPVTAYCVRDVMKNTLGVGPCEYIIAAEGLNDATPASVAEWVKKQFEKKKDADAADQIRERLDLMVQHASDSQKRLEGYMALAKRVREIAGEGADWLRKLAAGLDRSVEIRKTHADVAAEMRVLADRVAGLIGKPGAAEEVGRIGEQIERIGAVQDRSLANCRLAAKWMRLRCGSMAGSAAADPARAAAKEIDAVMEKQGAR